MNNETPQAPGFTPGHFANPDQSAPGKADDLAGVSEPVAAPDFLAQDKPGPEPVPPGWVRLDPPLILPFPIALPDGKELKEINAVKNDYSMVDLSTAHVETNGEPILLEVYLWALLVGVNPQDFIQASGKNYPILQKRLGDFTQPVLP